MKFKNYEELSQHPQAGMIPSNVHNNLRSLWNKNYRYRAHIKFPDEIISFLKVIQNNPYWALTYIRRNKEDLREMGERAALAFAIAYPEQPDLSSLHEIRSLLNLSDELLFNIYAEIGNIEVMEMLSKSHANDEWTKGVISTDSYNIFRLAAINGDLRILQYLAKKAPDKLQEMIAANDYEAFRQAARNGHLDVLYYLVEQASDKIQTMIMADKYDAFFAASSHGEMEVLQFLIKQAPDKLQKMIAANGYMAITWAASHGHLDIFRYLIAQASDDSLQSIIAENDYFAFRQAASNGHHLVLHYLAELAPSKLDNMIMARDYQALNDGCKHTEVANFLLSNAVGFAHAESHVYEYRNVVPNFIAERLETLRRMQVNHVGETISVTPEEAKHLFYVARALIRRSAPIDDLRLILEIPAVRELAHQTVTPNQPNELLLLATRLNNQEASAYLLTIPAVLREAEANNFYIDEYQGRMNLRAMTQDAESSMTALSQQEEKLLTSLSNHYLKKDKRNSRQILEELRTVLIKRYEADPARIITTDSNGKIKSLTLPYSWKEFADLSLSEKEKQLALEAYYKNKNHTAWRFLAKPNPWINPHATYANVDGFGKCSSFMAYAQLISILFSAAKDQNIPGIDGYTVDDRVTQFIDELGLIGRAHNWDKKNEKGEEYDDLTGDKPSCYSGTKRRLFQSVQGHPLLKQLTTDILRQETREFVWNHFQQEITAKNYQSLSYIWQKSIEVEPLTSQEKTVLAAINISEEKQRNWFKGLRGKYGEQTNNYEDFLSKSFKLSNEDSHFIQFGYLGLDQLLRNPTFQNKSVLASLDSKKQSLSTAFNTVLRFFYPGNNSECKNNTVKKMTP